MKRLLIALLSSFLFAVPALSQDDAAPAQAAATTATADIAKDKLEIQLRPMLVSEVEAEANAWRDLLAAKNKEISAAELASGADATTELSKQRTAIVERFEIVLKAMKARGGDITSYEQYIAASDRGLDASALMSTVTEWVTSPEGGIAFGLNIIKFLLTLFAFKIIAGIVAGILRKAVGRLKGSSDLLRDFVVNVVRRIVFFIGLIIALSMLGLDITPFVAALGAAGFVIGFALQGTLSNFACGLMILIYRPFDIGEVVNVAGTTGKVDAMTLVSTTLRLPDNQTVVIPNNSIWGNVITNVTSQSTRRCDLKFGCGYGDDLKKVQEVLTDIVSKHEKVLKDPEAVIKLHELADSSVNFIVRAWCKTGDYWDVYWDVTRAVKERFDAEGLSIPFPQQEVHMHQIEN